MPVAACRDKAFSALPGVFSSSGLQPSWQQGKHFRTGTQGVPEQDRLIQLDLNIHARRELELHEGVNRLVGRIDDVHQALVRPDLVLVTRVFVDVRRNEDREAFHFHGQRNRTFDGRAGTFRGIDDFACRFVDQAMIERLEPDAYVLIGCHVSYRIPFSDPEQDRP